MEINVLEIEVTDAKYRWHYAEDVFNVVAADMFQSGKRKVNKAVMELLRSALIKNKYPTLNDIFINCEYSDKTIANRKSDFRKSHYFDGEDRLTDLFHIEYFSRAGEYIENQSATKGVLIDSKIENDIQINALFRFDDVINILKKNCDAKFAFPDADVTVKEQLDYLQPTVQFVELSHMSAGTRNPFNIDFFYKCHSCGKTMRTQELLRKLKCIECDIRMERDASRDNVVACYASQVMHNGEVLPVISLVALPDGEFKAAIVMCRDEKNTKYFGFIVAVHERDYTESTLVLPKKDHAVWELIDYIDDHHEKQLGGHMRWLDYPKVAILFAAVANASGYASENVFFGGRAGVGKTALPTLYCHTLSLNCIVQDSVGTSVPGMVGSSVNIEVNGSKIVVQEPGLLARYNLLVVDEYYSQSDYFMRSMKTNLLSPSLVKNVSGTHVNMTKKGTVIATANIDTHENSKWQARFDELFTIYRANPDDYKDTSRAARIAWQELPLCNDPGLLIAETIKHEYHSRGRNWVDGKELAESDRFPLLFYIGKYETANDSSKKEPTVDDFKCVDYHRSAAELWDKIYMQDVRDYIQVCGQIDVNIKDEDYEQMVELTKRIHYTDMIHSDNRYKATLKRLLRYSAMLDQRDYLTCDDFNLVEELLLHTCNWFEPEQLSRTHRLKDKHMNARYSKSGEQGTHGHLYGGLLDKPERVTEIQGVISGMVDSFKIFDTDEQTRGHALTTIANGIVKRFGITHSVAEACIDDYLEMRLKELDKRIGGDNLFDREDVVEYIDATEDRREPFAHVKPGTEFDMESLEDVLVREFSKFRELTKETLTRFMDEFEIPLDDLNAHLYRLKQKGSIIDMGDFYRWSV